MRKKVVGVVGGAALMASIAAVTPALEAQVGGRTMPRISEMMLEGGGSEVGVSVRELNSDEIAKAKLAQAGGVLVEAVREGSPASRAGLMTGDIVVEFDGERVRGVRHFMRLVRETPPGRGIKGTIVRAGSRRDLEITPEAGDPLLSAPLPDLPQLQQRLRALPQIQDFPADLDPTPDLQVSPRGQIGVTLAPLSDQLASYFGATEGVLVSSVTTGSAAAQGGLKAGDVITALNGRPVKSVNDVTRAVRDAKPGSVLEMRLLRDKKEMTVKVMVPELLTEPRSVLPGGDVGRSRRPVSTNRSPRSTGWRLAGRGAGGGPGRDDGGQLSGNHGGHGACLRVVLPSVTDFGGQHADAGVGTEHGRDDGSVGHHVAGNDLHLAAAPGRGRGVVGVPANRSEPVDDARVVPVRGDREELLAGAHPDDEAGGIEDRRGAGEEGRQLTGCGHPRDRDAHIVQPT